MRVLRLILFVLAVLVMVELPFRVYLYGPAAINPVKMDSFNQIHHSGLVRRAADTAIYFELQPGLDTWYKGTRFVSNSAGLRDAEYSTAKPDDTFRVAVLGSSWTMGSGVAIENVWHSVMERKLSEAAGGRRIEFINFGVDQYGFGEIIATLKQKALPYEPDLILVAITNYTPAVLWDDAQPPYTELERRHPFFDSHALRVINHRLNLGLFPPDTSQRARAEGNGTIRTQLQRFTDELEEVQSSSGIPFVIAKLAITRAWDKPEEPNRRSPLSTSETLTYVDLRQPVIDRGYERNELIISVWDSHPNELAHELIADALADALVSRELLN